MNRETAFAGAIVVVLAAAAVLAALVPGVIAAPEPADEQRPGRLGIEEVTIAPGAVSGGTATLAVDARLAHRGGPSANVTVLLRAVDLDSGLVETERSLAVPTVEGDRETSVTGELSVEREGGYRVETVLFQDGERIAVGHKEVRGVGSLQPAYARTTVDFHRFEGRSARADLPVVEYRVADADAPGNRTTLAVSTYLTNTGDGAAGGLEVAFTARQAASNVVADEARVPVGTVESGRTARPETELTVPSGYNYYLDAVIWKDGVIVGTARSAANLNPSESLTVNVTRQEEGLRVSDFETDDRAGGDGGAPEARPTTAVDSGGQPGFGVGVAAVAVVLAAIFARRRFQ